MPFRVASEMTWDIRCNSWDEFPIAQKWFATGEAIAHLNYLQNSGRISRTDAADTIQYSPLTMRYLYPLQTALYTN